MPSMPPQGEIRQNHGLSRVMYMLNHGITADFAIICKPGWAAAWEEVGYGSKSLYADRWATPA